MYSMKVIPLLLIAIILISGCTQPGTLSPEKEKIKAEIACVLLCKLENEKERDLSQGPCISNEVIAGWVCDVVHSPRRGEDNDPVNQCPAYGKTASHFVEVDEYCDVIRSI